MVAEVVIAELEKLKDKIAEFLPTLPAKVTPDVLLADREFYRWRISNKNCEIILDIGVVMDDGIHLDILGSPEDYRRVYKYARDFDCHYIAEFIKRNLPKRIKGRIKRGDTVISRTAAGLQLSSTPIDGTLNQKHQVSCVLKKTGKVTDVLDITIDYDSWGGLYEGLGKLSYRCCLIETDEGTGWGGEGALIRISKA